MDGWVYMGTSLTLGGGRCGRRPYPRCPRRSRDPGRADSLAETDSGCSWPRAAGEPQNEIRCTSTSTERQKEKKKTKSRSRRKINRERGRVTQLGVRGDNGIITLNYPPPPNPIWFALFSQNAVIKCLIAAKPALMR